MQTFVKMTAVALALASTAGFAAAPPLAAQAGSATLRSTAGLSLPTRLDVGDPDSFGRQVRYMGVIASVFVDLEPTGGCQASTDPSWQCVILKPQPQLTTFSFNDMGHITLPGRSVHSLLCYESTALNSWQFDNVTATSQWAQIAFNQSLTIESAVLADPALIDPTTGQPFNGKLTVHTGLALNESQTLAPGAQQGHTGWISRGCQGGAISLTILQQQFGLSASVAKRMLQMPMTIRLNVNGRAQTVDSAGISFGVRFYGD